MSSGPIFITVWSGDDAVRVGRQLAGATDPLQADPGSIRGRYGLPMPMNTVHCSDSLESAEREISLFFKDDEILNGNETSFTCYVIERSERTLNRFAHVVVLEFPYSA